MDDLEGFMLRELSQRQTNTLSSHLQVGAKKKMNLRDMENRLVVARDRAEWGGGKMGEDGQKVQNFKF